MNLPRILRILSQTIEIPNRRFSPNTVGKISIFILTTQQKKNGLHNSTNVHFHAFRKLPRIFMKFNIRHFHRNMLSNSNFQAYRVIIMKPFTHTHARTYTHALHGPKS